MTHNARSYKANFSFSTIMHFKIKFMNPPNQIHEMFKYIQQIKIKYDQFNIHNLVPTVDGP